MVNQQIEKLLILQDRDLEVRRLADQLDAIPVGIKVHEEEIEAEQNALAESKSKLQALEVQRNDLDTQVGSAEDRISKYKTQQLQVKKNEEFQALTHEIEILEKQISEWEEAEIALMLDIDSEAAEYGKRESVYDSVIAKIQGQIEQLKEKSLELEQQLLGAKARFKAAKVAVESNFFNAYDRLASQIRLPVVVPVEEQKCCGCHLRISNDSWEQARKGERLTTCDNCGRIIY